MEVSSLLSRKEIKDHHHDHDHKGDSGHDHEHTNTSITNMVAGLVFIANSFFMEWFSGADNQVAGISAFVGAMILGYPILRLAVKAVSYTHLRAHETKANLVCRRLL